MNKKVIELTGVNFVNKGAELMLHAIIQQFSDANTYKLVSDFTMGTFEQRSQLGLHQKFRVNPLGYQFSDEGKRTAINNMKKDQEIFERFFHSQFSEGLGLVAPNEIDVILDASGFRYSSQWGDHKTHLGAFLYEQWNKEGKKIFLLPQAFGPFETDEIKQSFLKIVESASLICPRDEISYNNIMEICPDNLQNKVRKFPDFTCLVNGKIPTTNGKSDQVCLIPNFRMIDKTNSETASWYMNLLINIVQFLKVNNIEFFVLIHETGKDNLIYEEICKQIGFDIPLLREGDPLYIKGIISKSSAVIGSRYHGLISALTSNIPCIGIGWSHKYDELFNDFYNNDYLIKNLSSKEEVEKILNRFFFDQVAQQKYSEGMENGNIAYRSKVKEMWDLIKEEIHR
ncbi:polysaccharide pyruvyl transferase family protein [Robertmurraya sp. DFI.2.37]|uniref:polysaccharide pyruvyl transferase family protein n=1 Tax=Robertmurraya sp. DFI.2.37 TaxID=3031819 RepID=UPI001247B2C6|nr:polysaccharide pyruvyl transferase family protein [Robertmurraya sp. DFI.2.37]MDF1507837.1 polysaccharide pyruvyl transferase family protein [Robertmurraya sp. DFI.2.37]